MMKKLLWVGALLISTSSWAVDPIIDLNAIDPKVDPCQDFYHYACGNWIKTFELPADRPIYNRQSDGLSTMGDAQLNGILEAYSKGNYNVPSKYAQKLGVLYSSCMNTDQIETETAGFVMAQLAAIDAIQSPTDFAQNVAQLQMTGVNAFFSFGSTQDMHNSSQVIGQLDQGGMNFGDRGYYFNTDSKSLDTLAHYKTHTANLFTFLGEPSDRAATDAATTLAIETALAQKALAVEDMQDSTKLDHPMTLKQIEAMAPHFNWESYFKTLGLDETALAKTNVTNPDFFTGMDAILVNTPLDQLKIYLKFQVLHGYASELSSTYRNEDFQFWNAYLGGQKEPKPRWKFCTNFVGGGMRDALAEAYVDSFSNAETIKKNTETMINEIQAAFGSNLGQLDWLDDATRNAAKQKLSMVSDKIGFPAQWQNYDTLKLSDHSFLANVQVVSNYASRRDLQKIGKPTDRTLWDMPPWMINAYYNPSSNEMVFPIGALVPPIFDLTASWGANFGSIGGGWMGHELTHGFDSNGREFDGNGNLVNWWSPETLTKFNERTQCLVDQGDQYEILPGLKVNGMQTLTENLADQGGVKMGYIAFQALTAGKAPAANVGDFNERQQFWIAYAQSWCTKQTEESLRQLVATDVHPPAEFRTNVVLFNRPEFAADFSCKPGSRMAPEKRCSVW